MQYDIFLENKPVGSVYVESVGLYKQFQCQCSFPKEGLYRIIARYGDVRVDLGICIPEGNVYRSRAKVPTKNLSEDTPYFYALEGSKNEMVFIPVELHKSFDYIDKLQKARFHVRAGERGLLICNY